MMITCFKLISSNGVGIINIGTVEGCFSIGSEGGVVSVLEVPASASYVLSSCSSSSRLD
jgi:hypothetical protein